jgi:hypothetical protein
MKVLIKNLKLGGLNVVLVGNIDYRKNYLLYWLQLLVKLL